MAAATPTSPAPIRFVQRVRSTPTRGHHIPSVQGVLPHAGAGLGSAPWLPSALGPPVAELPPLLRPIAADDTVRDQPRRLVRGAVEVRERQLQDRKSTR